MKTINYLLAIMMVFSLAMSAQKTSTGTVTRCVDVDNFIVQVESYKGKEATLNVRIMNADGPELFFIPKQRPAQPYSAEAKQFSVNLIEGKQVHLTYHGRDRYGRVLAYVSIDNQRMDSILIINGIAWAWNEYGSRKDVKKSNILMEKAKAFKQGLWGLPNPIRPSDWRKGITSYPTSYREYDQFRKYIAGSGLKR